jgi:hypothetical protein
MSAAAQPSARPALGLRIPRPQRPAIAWGRWVVVIREHGFHVSRESASGARTEALTNEVGRTKIFRSKLLADAACDKANGSAS